MSLLSGFKGQRETSYHHKSSQCPSLAAHSREGIHYSLSGAIGFLLMILVNNFITIIL